MKALLLRDFYLNRRMLLILPLAFVIFFFQSQDPLFLPVILIMVGAFLILGTLRGSLYQEESSQDLMYYLCVDQGEKKVVASKYLLCFILTTLMALVLSLSLILLGGFSFKEILGFIASLFLTMFLIADLIIPVTIRYGEGVTKIVTFVFWVGIILGTNKVRDLLSQGRLEKIQFIGGKPGLAFGLLLVLVLVITFISYRLSRQALAKKEF